MVQVDRDYMVSGYVDRALIQYEQLTNRAFSDIHDFETSLFRLLNVDKKLPLFSAYKCKIVSIRIFSLCVWEAGKQLIVNNPIEQTALDLSDTNEDGVVFLFRIPRVVPSCECSGNVTTLLSCGRSAGDPILHHTQQWFRLSTRAPTAQLIMYADPIPFFPFQSYSQLRNSIVGATLVILIAFGIALLSARTPWNRVSAPTKQAIPGLRYRIGTPLAENRPPEFTFRPSMFSPSESNASSREQLPGTRCRASLFLQNGAHFESHCANLELDGVLQKRKGSFQIRDLL